MVATAGSAAAAFANFLLTNVAPGLAAILGVGRKKPLFGPGGSPVWNERVPGFPGAAFDDDFDYSEVVKITVSCENTWPAPRANATNCPGAPWYNRIKQIAGIVWRGYKQAASFQAGYMDQLLPGMRHLRRFGMWATGVRYVDEESTAYAAGEWTMFGVQTAVGGGASAAAKGFTIRFLRYPNAGGGGFNVYRFGVRRFALDWHKIKSVGPPKHSPLALGKNQKGHQITSRFLDGKTIVKGLFVMSETPEFPIFVKFEDGTVETYSDVEDLETGLEVFDSDQAPECEVRDSLGRRVRLRIADNLMLKELSLIE